MANPLSSLLRKIMRHSLLQSSANRVILTLLLIFALIIVLFVYGGYRKNALITACKEQGGTPVYRTQVQEFLDDGRGSGGINQKFQVFDYCKSGSK
ncbi:hypothetical protein HCG51_03345 [Tolypothrix sp. PCC 7910]|uniref:hypothetical protein n=1 Tax=Tolypothrix sp. PCC 7910 TaxID=2099387 RepID=UPI0014279CD2|nr:hypothetical protein [Tolypothrix sp. PCC 7910]QIR35885.1 hypothetical protein HCG51_03345 [Tolypothrix sp. PCC 7910]